MGGTGVKGGLPRRGALHARDGTAIRQVTFGGGPDAAPSAIRAPTARTSGILQEASILYSSTVLDSSGYSNATDGVRGNVAVTPSAVLRHSQGMRAGGKSWPAGLNGRNGASILGIPPSRRAVRVQRSRKGETKVVPAFAARAPGAGTHVRGVILSSHRGEEFRRCRPTVIRDLS